MCYSEIDAWMNNCIFISLHYLISLFLWKDMFFFNQNYNNNGNFICSMLPSVQSFKKVVEMYMKCAIFHEMRTWYTVTSLIFYIYINTEMTLSLNNHIIIRKQSTDFCVILNYTLKVINISSYQSTTQF